MRLAILPLLLITGCAFVEITGGTYAVKDGDGLRSGYGVGASAGIYFDAGAARVAVGGGGDFVHRNTPSQESWNAGGGGIFRLDAALPRGRGTLVFGSGGGGVGFRMRGTDDALTWDDKGRGWNFFLGSTAGAYGGNLGIFVSLGPSFIRTHSEMAGDMFAVGPQIRLMITGQLKGFGTLMGNANYPAPRFSDVLPKVQPVTYCYTTRYYHTFCY